MCRNCSEGELLYIQRTQFDYEQTETCEISIFIIPVFGTPLKDFIGLYQTLYNSTVSLLQFQVTVSQ